MPPDDLVAFPACTEPFDDIAADADALRFTDRTTALPTIAPLSGAVTAQDLFAKNVVMINQASE
jgi:hypothetical protein